jgi:hypothetical protein
VSQWQHEGPVQLELPLAPRRARAAQSPQPVQPAQPARPAPAPAAPSFLRVIQGGGERTHEPLTSRDAVVRVLVGAGADLLLRRISPERAQAIEQEVNEILDLFDRVDATPGLMPVLRRRLDELESLMGQTRDRRRRPGSAR